jgi:hypothetical protein
MSLAVVPDDKHGWRVIVANRGRGFLTSSDERRLADVQQRLRLIYELRLWTSSGGLSLCTSRWLNRRRKLKSSQGAIRPGVGEEMIGKNSVPVVPNMAQRALMQYLSLEYWKLASRLPVPAGELMLNRIRDYGWVEIQGEKEGMALRLTSAGLKAMKLPI